MKSRKANADDSRQGRKAARRSKGAGTLERHGRTWRAVWTVDGQTFRRSTGTADKREAEKILAELIAPYRLKLEADKDAGAAKRADKRGMTAAAGALAALSRSKSVAAGRLRVPLAGAWEAFNGSLSRRAVSPDVERIYEGRWGVFLAWVERNRPTAKGLADIDAETAAAFMREIRGRSSPKTFNDYRALLSQVWRILDKDAGLDGFNPWREIVPMDKQTHTRRELTAEELARVVEPLEGEWRRLFALGIYTGLRLGDCLALNWGAVDLVRGFIQWTPHKTEKHGTVVRIPLFPALASILAETPARSRRGLLVPGLAEDYARCTPPFCRLVKRVFEAAGIETQGETGRTNPKSGTTRKAVEVGFHSLRHTFVSLCANAGVPLHIVQAIVGHSNAAMTQHYFHVSDDALRGAVAALPDVFGGRPVPALPAPVVEVEAGSGPGMAENAQKCAKVTLRAREAVEAFKRACAGLAGANLSPADWREVAAALAAVEAKRRA
ncbi:MAG: tyrosine-type recombinase/integrase [Kiritimatiellae bacterium]|nr:tyrosine-type recombinase/integrase [Kiritimatiellia bacterium]